MSRRRVRPFGPPFYSCRRSAGPRRERGRVCPSSCQQQVQITAAAISCRPPSSVEQKGSQRPHPRSCVWLFCFYLFRSCLSRSCLFRSGLFRSGFSRSGFSRSDFSRSGLSRSRSCLSRFAPASQAPISPASAPVLKSRGLMRAKNLERKVSMQRLPFKDLLLFQKQRDPELNFLGRWSLEIRISQSIQPPPRAPSRVEQ